MCKNIPFQIRSHLFYKCQHWILHILFLYCAVPLPPSVAPSNFRDISVTSNTVTFTWNTLNLQEANGIVRWYIITCNAVAYNFVVSAINISYCNGGILL